MESRSLFEQVEIGLLRDGFVVIQGAFSSEYCARVREEIAELSVAGKIQPAKIGKGALHQLAQEVRGDSTYWFDPENLSEVQKELWEWLESVKVRLNSVLFLGLWDLEGHYAVYPQGRFYRKHLDRFQNDSKRTLSAVVFFNSGWRPEEGGCLRMETSGGVVEILPEAGTCVFFLSDRIPHEVTETHRERLSFAGWFKTRE